MDASAPRSTTVDDLARGVQSVQAFVQSVQAFARSVQSLPDERTVRRMKRDMARLRIATARLAARGDGATAAAVWESRLPLGRLIDLIETAIADSDDFTVASAVIRLRAAWAELLHSAVLSVAVPAVAEAPPIRELLLTDSISRHGPPAHALPTHSHLEGRAAA